MPKKKRRPIKQVGKRVANKKVLAGELTSPVNSASHDLAKTDPFNTEKWRRDFEALVNRSLKAQRKQFNAMKVLMRQSLAKAQAMQEKIEICRQVDKRLDSGEWDKYRGLSREQMNEVLRRIYNEELLAKMQQDLLTKKADNWEELRWSRIELIKWSKLPDKEKEKWLKLYNKPRPPINLIKGDNHADQTKEHAQESQPWPA